MKLAVIKGEIHRLFKNGNTRKVARYSSEKPHEEARGFTANNGTAYPMKGGAFFLYNNKFMRYSDVKHILEA